MRYAVQRSPDTLQNLRRLNSFLDDAFNGFVMGSEGGALTAAWTPAVDVSEDKDAVKIIAELPGVKPEDVKLSLENQTLTIRGEKRQEVEEKKERVHRFERSYGSFERTFALPGTVDAERIEASFANGLLTVTLPKVERARPRQIEIQTK